MAHKGWIGVDLDGTLAHYDGWVDDQHIGEPIPAMVDRVKRWLAEGYEVRIMTARAGHSNVRPETFMAIEVWLKEHVGQVLPITTVKDFQMIELWDDRCVQVVQNTGLPVMGSTSRVADLPTECCGKGPYG